MHLCWLFCEVAKGTASLYCVSFCEYLQKSLHIVLFCELYKEANLLAIIDLILHK